VPPVARFDKARRATPNLPFAEKAVNEFVEPLGRRILIRKDESRQKTRGGIVLPDKAEIPTITGRIVEVSAQIERDLDFPVRKYDKVLFHPKNAIPVDLEPDNLLFVVPIEDVVAVFRKVKSSKPPVETPDGAEPADEA
jgi:chaperonin GroES